jgi:acyl-CoA synthetase (AMP-forming)/AMP-acid ligase II
VAEISRVFRSSFPEVEFSGFRSAVWRDGVAAGADELRPLYPTLLHALAHAAKADATTGVTLLPDGDGGAEVARSFRALYRDAQALAARLPALGVAPGDRVLLVFPTSLEFVTTFFAVQMAGAIPVPSYPPAVLERAELALERLGHVARHSGAAVCLTTRALRPILGGLAFSGGVREIAAVETLATRPAGPPLHPRPRPEDAAFIQYTSGSTGAPKGVLLHHANVIANLHAMGQAMRISRSDVGVSWLPLYHDMGLIGALLSAVYWRLPVVLLSPVAFLERPLRWLEAITRFRATLSPAPNFAYSLAVARTTPAERARLDLSSWRVAFNGAESVNARTMNDFIAAFAPHGFAAEAMLPVYGLAEVSLAAAFPTLGTPPRTLTVDRKKLAAGRVVPSADADAMTLVSVGRAVPGHEIAVVDAEGAPLPEREVGHIVVRGPSVMAGYYRAPEATADVVRDDALWTGDLGFRLDGDLFVTGRAKDLIIVRGRNYYAEDIERVAAAVPGVRPGGVAAFGLYDDAKASDAVVLVCETKLVDEAARIALVQALAEAVARRAGVPLDQVMLLGPGSLPKTSSGKPQRARARELFLEGTLDKPRANKQLAVVRIFGRSFAGFAAQRMRRVFK